MSDFNMRRKQDIWENPRNIAILVAAVAAIAGALGYEIAQIPPRAQPPIIINVPAQAPAQK
jgi:hypothetical protein